MTSKKEDYPTDDNAGSLITTPCKICGKKNSLILLETRQYTKKKIYSIRCICCNTIVKIQTKEK